MKNWGASLINSVIFSAYWVYLGINLEEFLPFIYKSTMIYEITIDITVKPNLLPLNLWRPLKIFSVIW